MSQKPFGEPIQIFTTTSQKNGYRHINEEAIQTLLDKVGDRLVAIISSNGEPRTGKSTLLNAFMHMHLQLQPEGQLPLPGFKWDDGCRSVTAGMYVWSEPFLVKDEFGRQIAVLLLDTQGLTGVGDDEEEKLDEEYIFCLSFLLSSLFINNTRHHRLDEVVTLPESLLDRFNIRVKRDGQETLQSLIERVMFVVHDWPHTNDLSAGMHDTRSLMTDYGQATGRKVEKREELLHFTSACLLPHPGSDRCMGDSSRYVPLYDQSTNYGLLVESVVSHLFQPKNGFLKPKTIFEREVSGSMFKVVVAKWAELFRHHRGAPKMSDLSEIFVEIYLEAVAKDLESQYARTMGIAAQKGTKENEYEELNSKEREEALLTFQKMALQFGPDRLVHSQRLEDFMTKMYPPLRDENKTLVAKKRLLAKVKKLTKDVFDLRIKYNAAEIELRENELQLKQVPVLQAENRRQQVVIQRLRQQLAQMEGTDSESSSDYEHRSFGEDDERYEIDPEYVGSDADVVSDREEEYARNSEDSESIVSAVESSEEGFLKI